MADGTASGNAAAQSRSSRSPRILITRLSAIGDCILTMPLAVALREAMPQAFIAWTVEGVAGTLVEKHSAVDLAIRLPRRFLRSPQALWRLRSDLRQQQFDIAIDPQGLSKSAIVARISGARRRIGFSRPVGRELSPWLNTELVQSSAVHVVNRYLELLQPFGTSRPGAVRFAFPTDPAAESCMATMLASLGFNQRFAVINPGAGWESKVWPADRYAAVAQDLARGWQVRSLVVWAGDQEHDWARQIVAASGNAAVVAPATSLLELAAVLRRATLFIGSDTGPLHMAAAVGTRCVGIYGPTNPEVCGPYGPLHEVLRGAHEPQKGQRRSTSNSAMRAVTTESVVLACGRILASLRGAAA